MITAVKEKPILFSTSMVRAILEGRKTQTRRVVSKNNSVIGEGGDWSKLDFKHERTFVDHGFPDIKTGEKNYQYLHVPYDWQEDETIYRVYSKFEVGQRLWVKETFYIPSPNHKPVYKATTGEFGHLWKWKPSIFMPRWASRITLEVTKVRVQKVDQISEEDAIAEGFEADKDNPQCISARSRFAQLWDELNDKRGYGWKPNVWVWAISFKVVGNVQTMAR